MKKLILLLSLMLSMLHTEEKNNPKVVSREISIECDNQGYPKKKALKALVAALYSTQLNKTQQGTISLKEISGGYYTEKMYLVLLVKNGQEFPLFYFKISNKTSATENLIKLQEGPVRKKLQELLDPHAPSTKNMPEIIWLNNLFTYKDKTGVARTIEVTPSAPGELVKNILESHNMTKIKRCAQALGKSLASFHQLFMNYNDSDNPKDWTTMCHRDFSIKNALIDPTTNKVYFIDNETMDEASLGQDIKTILISLTMFYYLKHNYRTRWPLYLEYCLAFLKNYIESYPQEHRAQLALFIEKALTADLNRTLHTTIVTDASLNKKDFNEQEFKKVIYEYLHTFKK